MLTLLLMNLDFAAGAVTPPAGSSQAAAVSHCGVVGGIDCTGVHHHCGGTGWMAFARLRAALQQSWRIDHASTIG